MPKLRTKAQNSKMFGLAAKCNLTHEDLRDWAADVSNGRTEKTSKLYIKEADTIINHLDALVNPQKEWSPRTIRYHRQKSRNQENSQPESRRNILTICDADAASATTD